LMRARKVGLHVIVGAVAGQAKKRMAAMPAGSYRRAGEPDRGARLLPTRSGRLGDGPSVPRCAFLG